jgi:prophage regulatory protein
VRPTAGIMGIPSDQVSPPGRRRQPRIRFLSNQSELRGFSMQFASRTTTMLAEESAAPAGQNASTPERFLTMAELCRLLPACRQSIYDWIKAGTFPKPYKLGPKKIGFLQSEIAAWQRSRKKAA